MTFFATQTQHKVAECLLSVTEIYLHTPRHCRDFKFQMHLGLCYK